MDSKNVNLGTRGLHSPVSPRKGRPNGFQECRVVPVAQVTVLTPNPCRQLLKGHEAVAHHIEDAFPTENRPQARTQWCCPAVSLGSPWAALQMKRDPLQHGCTITLRVCTAHEVTGMGETFSS